MCSFQILRPWKIIEGVTAREQDKSLSSVSPDATKDTAQQALQALTNSFSSVIQASSFNILTFKSLEVACSELLLPLMQKLCITTGQHTDQNTACRIWPVQPSSCQRRAEQRNSKSSEKTPCLQLQWQRWLQEARPTLNSISVPVQVS